MKRFLTLILAAGAACTLMAQSDEFDAARIARQDIKGTARYTAMGGAFAALGGDASAIQDNPAAIGVYRRSDLTFTMDFSIDKTESTWGGRKMNDSKFNFGVDNTAFILSVTNSKKRSGLISSNFGFAYNRIKTYNRRLYLKQDVSSASMTDFMALHSNNNQYTSPANFTSAGSYDPYNNSNISWLQIMSYEGYMTNFDTLSKEFSSLLDAGETVRPTYFSHERGNMSEFNFTWGGTISNIAYLGFGLNLRSLDYTLESTYAESFEKGGSFSLNNYYSVDGVGLNLSAGVIIQPADFLRIGASIQTPTWWTLEDKNYGSLNYRDIDFDGTAYSGTQSSPVNGDGYKYDLNTPFKTNFGLAAIIGKQAVISAEYEFSNYRGMKYKDANDPVAFTEANEGIKDIAQNMHAIKIGAEYKPVDEFAIRLGYAYQTAPTKDDAMRWIRWNTTRTDTEYSVWKGTQYFSAGIGYRGNIFYADLAYQYRMGMEDFYSFSNATYNDGNASWSTFENLDGNSACTPARIHDNRHNIVATIGLRF
ncbi:MAG: hypothetical protein IJ680_09055 [Paludibacteraceae bacterium]|nr:hypothetical protein [Paludibacteraceae bacterium]